MPESAAQTADMIDKQLFPAFMAEKEHLERIDKWYRWDHESPHSPRHATREYKELAVRAESPWGGLVVTSVAQSLYVDGYRQESGVENSESWAWWEANRMSSRQIPVHRATLAYGLSYLTVLPGDNPLTGEAIPAWKGHTPKRMTAFYADPANDEFPVVAMAAEPAMIDGTLGWVLEVYDDRRVWRFHANADGGNLKYVTYDEHNVGVCPVVRFANMLDLEGRSHGEIQPFIPLFARIDQTVFDRLVVQRFASWKVRTIAGMSKPDGDEDAAAARLRLMVEDLLVAEDPDTKFGTLPETPLAGFLEAAKADVMTLAAVSQTPAHEMLGAMVNLSAEALAAAKASMTAKKEERQYAFSDSWEQAFRLSAHIMGDAEGAADVSSEVRWRDTETRSLAQAADALGKMATMLQVPVEMLWERIPGWTPQDSDRAKALVEDGGGIADLLRELADGQTSQDG